MSIASRLSNWFRRLRRRWQKEGSYLGRREFVYLDEVSVLSILASWTEGIATEFSETQSTSQSTEDHGSLSVGFSGTKASFGNKMQTGQVNESQVLRKAIIQNSFRELYDIERLALALRLSSPDHIPPVDSTSDLEELLDSSEATGLLIDTSAFHRGDLLEVEVELEADPIFHLTTIISFFTELMGDGEELIERSVTAQLPELRSVARLLERLLAGLIPIRGRLVDYGYIQIRDRDFLVRQSLLDQIPIDERPKACPVILVGVGLNDLFWKDIRRVLFSKARYTVFCRLATSGLTDGWNPVKMLDVFSGIASDFNETIQGLGDELMMGFNKNVRPATHGKITDASTTPLTSEARRGDSILQNYVESLASYHERDIAQDHIRDLVRGTPRAEKWLDTVDDYRPTFEEVTKKVDALLEVQTSSDAAHDLRSRVLKDSRREATVKLDSSTASCQHPEPRLEKFLDAEIIAIYW